MARCQVLLARLYLADSDLVKASAHITHAVATYRDGDYLVEVADALTVAAEQARLTVDLDAADRHTNEALDIAAPRGLAPTHAAAFAARARIAADRYSATGDSDQLYRGRDAAAAALRLSTGADPLPWAELDALRAHAHLDQAERVDRGWAQREDSLYHQLVPDGLDPDPLATVEAEVARKGQAGARTSHRPTVTPPCSLSRAGDPGSACAR